MPSRLARPVPGEHAAAFSSASPGQVVTSVLVRLAAQGVRAEPRVNSAGARVDLPRTFTRGRGELLVAAHEDGSRVALLGVPPLWPFRIGWARRTLRGILGSQLERYDEVSAVAAAE